MVFITKGSKAASKDLTVAGMTGRRTKKGHVGLEVEVESSIARSLPKEGLGKIWYHEHDGSLRGADNAEYILRKPISFDEVDPALDELWGLLKEKKAKLSESNRTSVHVHLNVLPFYQNRLVALLALWYTFEEILTAYCGDDRIGNMFCQRAKDGPAVLSQIRDYIESKGTYALPEGTHHYAALNVSQIWQHGSIEMRTMRGVLAPEPIKVWVKILRKLYDLSANYKDPRTIIEEFSLGGPVDFFRNTFREYADVIQKECGMTSDEFRASLYEGMRYAQELVYARSWADFKPEVVTEDPFGRTTIPPMPPDRPAEAQVWGQPEGDLEEYLQNGDRPLRAGRLIRTRAGAVAGGDPFFAERIQAAQREAQEVRLQWADIAAVGQEATGMRINMLDPFIRARDENEDEN